MFQLRFAQTKYEVDGKAPDIQLDLLVQPLGGDAVLILRSLLAMVGGFHPLSFSPYPFKRGPHGFSATTLPFFQT